MKKYGHALVLGLGASGESAARLLAGEGSGVTVVDQAESEELTQRRDALRALDVRVELGATMLPDENFDVCVVSPGVTPGSAWLAEMKKRGTKILPEFELGWSRRKARVVAVTGTNGKSTMVKWIADTLNEAGQVAVPCGNYGYPVCSAVIDHGDAAWLVIEISSFQLENVDAFRPDVGLLLNLLPNHLDRHGTMDDYTSAKSRLFAHTIATDACIVHEPLLERIRELSGGAGHWISFGETRASEYVYRSGRVQRAGKNVANLEGTYFANDVLGCNAAGGVAALESCGVPSKFAVQSAMHFEPLPHRMQPVRDFEGVKFVDDSKATTLTALSAGLRMCTGKARLVAGGLLKENDLDSVKKVLAERASAIYLIGRASETMFKAWSGIVSCVICETLDRAVTQAWRDARSGETVLLSPGCASFDQFRSYAERGDRFKNLVQNLTGRNDRGK